MELNTLLLLGTILSFGGPLVPAIWRETRFVKNWAAGGYGVASAAFGILYYSNSGGSEIGWWALWIFVLMGIAFTTLAIIFRKSDIWEDERSLPFSYKTIAGFQLGFLFVSFVPSFFDGLPQMAQLPFTNIVIWGIFLTLILHATIAPVRYVKN